MGYDARGSPAGALSFVNSGASPPKAATAQSPPFHMELEKMKTMLPKKTATIFLGGALLEPNFSVILDHLLSALCQLLSQFPKELTTCRTASYLIYTSLKDRVVKSEHMIFSLIFST